MRFHLDPLLDEPVGDRSLTADGQYNYAIQSSVWPVLPTSSHILTPTKELVFKGLIC